MRDSRSGNADKRLDELLERTRDKVRAPRGFAHRVMEVVYKEALAGAPGRPEQSRPTAWQGPAAARLYRRVALSLMITAAVLAVSLVIPHGAYPTLIGAASGDAAIGAGPSEAVQSALSGAGHTVQGALGEKQIGGSSE